MLSSFSSPYFRLSESITTHRFEDIGKDAGNIGEISVSRGNCAGMGAGEGRDGRKALSAVPLPWSVSLIVTGERWVGRGVLAES